MKLGQILDSMDAVNNLMTEKVTIGTALKLKKIAEEITKATELFDEKRKELLEKYGEAQEDGNYKINDVEAFNTEIMPILDEDIDIDIKKINVDALEDVKLDTITVAKLEWILED